MLVDDHQPILGLGDDVGRGDLAARDAERIAGHRLDRRLGAARRGMVEEARGLATLVAAANAGPALLGTRSPLSRG